MSALVTSPPGCRCAGRHQSQAATTSQVTSENSLFDSYVYLWWVGELDGESAAVAHGFGCQVIAVVPAHKLVAAMVTELQLSEPPGPMTRGLDPDTCRTILESAVVGQLS